MRALRSLIQRARHQGYRWRYERGFADTLIAYESVFEEILTNSDIEPTPQHPLNIDFAWVCDSASYDAEAIPRGWLRGRRVKISVHWLSAFQGLANAVFRACDTFPGLGDASKDRFCFADLLAGGDAIAGPDISADPLRQEASCVTVELALAMIILHEIGHHALGHTEYGHSFREADHTIQENSPLHVGRLQAYEIAADRFSFSRVLAWAAVGRSPFRTQLVSDAIVPHLFDLAILAYSLVITLLHPRDEPLEHFDTLEHPHPAVRLFASQRYFAEFLVRHPEVRQRYLIGWRESLRVIAHNADQMQTLHLLAHQRHRLEEKLAWLMDVPPTATTLSTSANPEP